jgi:transposase
MRADLRAIFVSMESSRSTRLVTSLSPSGREKMSKHAVRGGDLIGSLERFMLQDMTQARIGEYYPVVVIQEARLDGSWMQLALEASVIESHEVDPASIRVPPTLPV